jgi:hypothetical protein
MWSARPSGLIPFHPKPSTKKVPVARSWLSLQADRRPSPQEDHPSVTRQAQPPRPGRILHPKLDAVHRKARSWPWSGSSPLLSSAERLADLTAGRPRIAQGDPESSCSRDVAASQRRLKIYQAAGLSLRTIAFFILAEERSSCRPTMR